MEKDLLEGVIKDIECCCRKDRHSGQGAQVFGPLVSIRVIGMRWDRRNPDDQESNQGRNQVEQ